MAMRFPQPLRNVEDLLVEHGIDVCHEGEHPSGVSSRHRRLSGTYTSAFHIVLPAAPTSGTTNGLAGMRTTRVRRSASS